jgi:hypothetical protein
MYSPKRHNSYAPKDAAASQQREPLKHRLPLGAGVEHAEYAPSGKEQQSSGAASMTMEGKHGGSSPARGAFGRREAPRPEMSLSGSLAASMKSCPVGFKKAA